MPISTAPDVTLGRLVRPVYLPMMAGSIGLGMLIPVLPLYLSDVGLSLRGVSVVLAGSGLGAAIASLPIGSLLARVGERRVMLGALALLVVATVSLGVTTAMMGLLALRMGAGASAAALRLSRQAFIARRVVGPRRGRSMAMIGGSFRFSLFIGPLLGGWLAETTSFSTTFVVAGGLTALGLIPAFLDQTDDIELLTDVADAPQFGVIDAMRRHWRPLMIAGVVPLLVMAVREGRFVLLPLISDDLGLRPTTIGVVVSVGTAADLLLFPVAGWVMDRFGRLFAIVPAFTLIAAGLVVLGLASNTATVVIAGAIIGVGNGLSSGTMLTFGSDLAPSDATGPFLAGLAAMQDAGRVLGPLLVGVIGAGAGLGVASFALAAVLGGAVAWLVVVIGETSRPGARVLSPR